MNKEDLISKYFENTAVERRIEYSSKNDKYYDTDQKPKRKLYLTSVLLLLFFQSLCIQLSFL